MKEAFSISILRKRVFETFYNVTKHNIILLDTRPTYQTFPKVILNSEGFLNILAIISDRKIQFLS